MSTNARPRWYISHELLVKGTLNVLIRTPDPVLYTETTDAEYHIFLGLSMSTDG